MTRALEAAPGRVKLLTETTAGQGASLGHTFEQLARIREAIPKAARRRTALCLDTCHLFASGHDLTSEEGYRKTFQALDDALGLELVAAFHLNDSKKGLGCRVDRHEHIGDGAMGLAPFRRLVNDVRFASTPAFLETDLRYRENLAVLRTLIA
jgi:deoxyribonuclease-4